MHELLAKQSEELKFKKLFIMFLDANKQSQTIHIMYKDFIFLIKFKDGAYWQLRRMLTGGIACTYEQSNIYELMYILLKIAASPLCRCGF